MPKKAIQFQCGVPQEREGFEEETNWVLAKSGGEEEEPNRIKRLRKQEVWGGGRGLNPPLSIVIIKLTQSTAFSHVVNPIDTFDGFFARISKF